MLVGLYSVGLLYPGMWPDHSPAHYNCSGPIKKTNEARAYHVTQEARVGGTEAGSVAEHARRRYSVGWKTIA